MVVLASLIKQLQLRLLSFPLQDAIGKAVASAGKTTGVATRKGVDYAQMANRGGSVQPYMFDDTGAKRHLLNGGYQRSDKMQMAGMAAQVSWGCGFLGKAAFVQQATV
jgi:hypothetical protein